MSSYLNLEREAVVWQDCRQSHASDRPMNVIPIERARSRLRPHQRIEPPSALGGPAPAQRGLPAADDADDRLRMRQNLAAVVVIAAIVVLGSWLIDNLQHYSRLQACIEAGHRNCLPLEAKYQPSPYRR
jgi:hypothetical protein